MNIKELLEKRAALLAELQKPETTKERFDEVRAEVAKLNYTIEELRKDEAQKKAEEDAAKEAELRGARLPIGGGTLFDQNKLPTEEERKQAEEKIEKRAATLKKGEAITFDSRAAVASGSTALGTAVSASINPTFEQVGTLDQLVNNVHLEGVGAESYKKPFVKTIGEGVITEEGKAPATTAEPTFGYADINKVKIVAYAEVNEEVEKLPAANYIAEVDAAVVGAWKKKVNAQIMNGSGSGELVGIVNAPTSIIEAGQRKTIATIDENTLDEVVFEYGGDEEVEGDAMLILNKLTLKEFAKVKGSDKKRAYEIVVRGNTGTINGIPFVCTSRLAPFATVEAGKPYMVYGKMKGYELAHFTALEVAKSTDYKFKEGVIAFKVTGFVGGSPAMWNGFASVQKAAGTTNPVG